MDSGRFQNVETGNGKKAVRFSVLKAGTALPKTKERLGDYGELFVDTFSEPGQAWDIHDVEHGEFPEEPSAYDGFVITGSRASVYENLPWIRSLERLIRWIHELELPLVGICFGHQVVAKALGGEVRPNEQGWTIGVREVFPTPSGEADAPFRGAPNRLRILKSHQDTVVALPPGAVHLVTSDSIRHEMFAVGQSVLCLQGHPEFDHETVQEIIEELKGRGVLSRSKEREATESLSLHPHREFWTGLLKTFLFSRPGPSKA